MGKLVNIVTKLHKATKRSYVQRMLNEKIKCMKIAKKYGKDFWDGKKF